MLFVSLSLTGSVILDWGLLILFLYLSFGIYSYHKLSHVPGPRLWGWTLLPLMRIHVTGDIYDKFGELSNQYGPLVRIAPRSLLASDPDILRRMNSAKSPYIRAPWYVAMRLIPGQDNILSTIDEKRHDRLRRTMGLAYSGKENVSLEQDIDHCVRELINLMETKYVSQVGSRVPIKMDLAEKMQFFTSDVMSKLAFDAKFNDLRDDHDNLGYINEVETVFPNIFWTSIVPSFMQFLTQIGILTLAAPSDNSTLGFGRVLAICKEQVAKRFDNDGKLLENKKDMLGSFLQRGLTQKEAEQEGVLQLAAGTDTTATTLRSAMLGLMTNLKAQRKLAAEIASVHPYLDTLADHDAIVSDEQARKMPYLQACIKESLRWLPPVVGMLAKQTPPEGDTINGYYIPGGISIAYSAKAIHHSKLLFGPDEDAFRPDRWIHVSEGGDECSWERLKSMEKNNELVFGYGKNSCLGKNVAFIELNKVIVELVRRFELTVVNPLKPMDTTCYGIHFQKNFWVTVSARDREHDEKSVV